MNEDRIAEIRARHNHIEETWWAPDDPCVNQAHDDRGYLLAEIERLAHHIKELQEKIDAEKSCACSFDGPGDICAAHSPALMRARAEVERLRAHNARLRAQVSEYFTEPATHPLEET